MLRLSFNDFFFSGYERKYFASKTNNYCFLNEKNNAPKQKHVYFGALTILQRNEIYFAV